jgi:hypothetical protein
VPPFVARVIDNTTQPLRTARHVFEDVEEVAFSFKRTRKVTVDTQTSEPPPAAAPVEAPAEAPAGTGRIESSRGQGGHATREATSKQRRGQLGVDDQHSSLEGGTPKDLASLSVGTTERDGQRELVERDGPPELRSPDGPRELPPPQ